MLNAGAVLNLDTQPVEYDRECLVESFYPQIKILARRLVMRLPANVMVEDLIDAGALGLMDAADKFDPSRGVRFSTYAEYRIRGAMLDEIRAMDWLSRSMRRKASTLKKGVDQAQQRLGRSATDEEVSAELGLDDAEYQKLVNDAGGVSVVSVEDLSRDDSRDAWERVPDHDQADPLAAFGMSEACNAITSAIEGLNEKERLIITLYYYEELTMKEVGQVMGLTESRVSQIHSMAVNRLRLRLREYRG